MDVDYNLKFANATEENFNLILVNNKIDIKYDFDMISSIYDKLLEKIGVNQLKSSEDYEKKKKKFTKFLNYNYKFVKHHLELDKNIIELFEDAPSKNWYLLHLSFVSYLSYLKQTSSNLTINYKGMIDKLMSRLEEFSASESEIEPEAITEPNTNKMLEDLQKQIPHSENTPTVMKGLLTDIKDILNNTSNIESQNIVDISKNLSSKYQTMIEKGDVNIGDLLSGVLGLINDPDSLNDEFSDIDVNNLPNPENVLSDMANDPNLKEAMSMMSNDNNMNMFSSMMSSMMGGANSSTNNKSLAELEKEIEQMMQEVQEAENNKNSFVEQVESVEQVEPVEQVESVEQIESVKHNEHYDSVESVESAETVDSIESIKSVEQL